MIKLGRYLIKLVEIMEIAVFVYHPRRRRNSLCFSFEKFFFYGIIFIIKSRL